MTSFVTFNEINITNRNGPKDVPGPICDITCIESSVAVNKKKMLK
jgi:hypothetical protein